MDRAALQRTVSDLVDECTVHRVIHALVEVCYHRASLRAAMHDLDIAERWNAIARTLTHVEGVTHTLDL